VMLLLPFQRDFVQCVIDEERPAAEAAAAPSERRVGGRIQEPKKVKHVNPVYPDSARAAGVQGTVVIESTISRAGCIRSLEVIRGVDAALDAAAVAAVAGWRYTPTLLNGRPVPVLMTVTVNFRMN
jgi:periplasmic protein TonB